jgi:hypothetical protein
MYKIEKTEYGFKLTFSGNLQKEEMERWVSESKEVLEGNNEEFGVFVDLTLARPIDKETTLVMKEGQKLYKSRGMQRSAVVLNNTIATLQFREIAKSSGIYKCERYIDASRVKNWEKVGLMWVVEAVEPEAG